MVNIESPLQAEVKEMLAKIRYWSDSFSNLVPVTYKSKMQWFGGVPGAIIEYKEKSRLEKMINTPIIDDLSYWNLSFMIMDIIKELGAKTEELQNSMPSDSDERIQLGDEVATSIMAIVKNWKSYSPSMANVVVDFGSGKKKDNKSLLQKMLEDASLGIGYFYMTGTLCESIRRELPLMLII